MHVAVHCVCVAGLWCGAAPSIPVIQPKAVCVLLSTAAVVVVVSFSGTMQFPLFPFWEISRCCFHWRPSCVELRVAGLCCVW